MGIWGAAQAIAFAMGGLVGTGLSDLARILMEDAGTAYALVFCVQAAFFIAAALLAKNLFSMTSQTSDHRISESTKNHGPFAHEGQ